MNAEAPIPPIYFDFRTSGRELRNYTAVESRGNRRFYRYQTLASDQLIDELFTQGTREGRMFLHNAALDVLYEQEADYFKGLDAEEVVDTLCNTLCISSNEYDETRRYLLNLIKINPDFLYDIALFLNYVEGLDAPRETLAAMIGPRFDDGLRHAIYAVAFAAGDYQPYMTYLHEREYYAPFIERYTADMPDVAQLEAAEEEIKQRLLGIDEIRDVLASECHAIQGKPRPIMVTDLDNVLKLFDEEAEKDAFGTSGIGGTCIGCWNDVGLFNRTAIHELAGHQKESAVWDFRRQDTVGATGKRTWKALSDNPHFQNRIVGALQELLDVMSVLAISSWMDKGFGAFGMLGLRDNEVAQEILYKVTDYATDSPKHAQQFIDEKQQGVCNFLYDHGVCDATGCSCSKDSII